MASKKEKRYAIKYVLELAGKVECEDLPHPTKHKHDKDIMCTAEYHRDRQLYLVREMLEKIDL